MRSLAIDGAVTSQAIVAGKGYLRGWSFASTAAANINLRDAIATGGGASIARGGCGANGADTQFFDPDAAPRFAAGLFLDVAGTLNTGIVVYYDLD